MYQRNGRSAQNSFTVCQPLHVMDMRILSVLTQSAEGSTFHLCTVAVTPRWHIKINSCSLGYHLRLVTWNRSPRLTTKHDLQKDTYLVKEDAFKGVLKQERQ